MVTAVIDLTELVRMVLQGPKQSRLFQVWENQAFIWAISQQILTEFIEVTNRPKLQRITRPLVKEAIINVIKQRCWFVTPATKFPPCRDSKDNIVIATAISAQADFIITSDKDLLDEEVLTETLLTYKIQTVLPKTFLDSLPLT